jgi:hypothetical protein
LRGLLSFLYVCRHSPARVGEENVSRAFILPVGLRWRLRRKFLQSREQNFNRTPFFAMGRRGTHFLLWWLRLRLLRLPLAPCLGLRCRFHE